MSFSTVNVDEFTKVTKHSAYLNWGPFKDDNYCTLLHSIVARLPSAKGITSSNSYDCNFLSSKFGEFIFTVYVGKARIMRSPSMHFSREHDKLLDMPE